MAATLIKAATASITAADVAASVTGLPSPSHVAVQVVGTFSATITFEVTVDGATWAAIEMLPSTDLSDTGLTATATSAGLFVSKVPLAVSGVRARVSTFTNNTNGVITLRVSSF